MRSCRNKGAKISDELYLFHFIVFIHFGYFAFFSKEKCNGFLLSHCFGRRKVFNLEKQPRCVLRNANIFFYFCIPRKNQQQQNRNNDYRRSVLPVDRLPQSKTKDEFFQSIADQQLLTQMFGFLFEYSSVRFTSSSIEIDFTLTHFVDFTRFLRHGNIPNP